MYNNMRTHTYRYDIRNRLEDKSQFGLKPSLPHRMSLEEEALEDELEKERYLALGVDIHEEELREGRPPFLEKFQSYPEWWRALFALSWQFWSRKVFPHPSYSLIPQTLRFLVLFCCVVYHPTPLDS